MKFKLIFLICLITSVFLKKQKTVSGTVTYAFKANSRDSIKAEENREYYKAFDFLNKAAKDITFGLTFNDSESFFEINRTMDSDLGANVLTYAENIITEGKYYYNKKEDYMYTEAKSYDKYTLIKSKPSEVKWIITKETKKIDKFNCFKATSIQKIKNNTREIQVLIEAWFTTDVPLSYGPLEFNNLPGLILEVKAPNFTFFANKIEFSEELIQIKKLSSKNIITQQEHQENLKKISRK